MRNIFRRASRGATAMTYGLVVGLVGIAALGAVTEVGGGVDTLFTDVSTDLAGGQQCAANAAGDGWQHASFLHRQSETATRPAQGTAPANASVAQDQATARCDNGTVKISGIETVAVACENGYTLVNGGCLESGTSPTSLRLIHNAGENVLRVNWTGGQNIGSCQIRVGGVAIASATCDNTYNSSALNLESAVSGPWSSIPVTVVSTNGVFNETVGSITCTPISSGSSPDQVDNDCDGTWDEANTSGAGAWTNANFGSCCWEYSDRVEYHEKGSWNFSCAESEISWPGRTTLNNTSSIEYRCVDSEVANYCYGQHGVPKSSCYGSA